MSQTFFLGYFSVLEETYFLVWCFAESRAGAQDEAYSNQNQNVTHQEVMPRF